MHTDEYAHLLKHTYTRAHTCTHLCKYAHKILYIHAARLHTHNHAYSFRYLEDNLPGMHRTTDPPTLLYFPQLRSTTPGHATDPFPSYSPATYPENPKDQMAYCPPPPFPNVDWDAQSLRASQATKVPTRDEIFAMFQSMQQQVMQIGDKINELQMDVDEHRYAGRFAPVMHRACLCTAAPTLACPWHARPALSCPTSALLCPLYLTPVLPYLTLLVSYRTLSSPIPTACDLTCFVWLFQAGRGRATKGGRRAALLPQDWRRPSGAQGEGSYPRHCRE